MAVFDKQTGKLFVRIVYDGPPLAGKTTNLQQLQKVFTPKRRSELYSTESASGRTLYLDWLQIDGGLVAGHAMSCQLMSVPGQAALAERRAHLLTLADVVVFVADSDREKVKDNELLLRSLRAEAHVPIVLQANKQDRPEASSPDELLVTLGLPPETPRVGARAHDGVGVRETLVLAVRTACEGVQQQILEAGLSTLEGAILNGEELVRQLKEKEVTDRRSRVDVVLERYAQASPTARVANDARDPRADSTIQSPPPQPGESEPKTNPTTAAPVPTPTREAASSSESSAKPLNGRTPVKLDVSSAPLPSDEVPSGHIWPSATGRQIIRQIPIKEVIERTDLEGRYGLADGSGKDDVRLVEVGPWCLKTSARRAFDNVESARTALLHLARRKILLGGLMVKDTVLTLAQDSSGQHWLWTIAPWVSTLGSAMALAVDTGNGALLAEGLVSFANVAVESMQLAARQRLALDVHPSNFACVRDRAYYVDDDIELSNRLPAIGHSLLKRVDEYRDWPDAVESYLACLERTIPTALTRADIDTIGLVDSLDQSSIQSMEGTAAKSRLLNASVRCA